MSILPVSLDLDKINYTFDDGVKERLISLILQCCPKEIVLMIIGTSLSIGLKQFIQVPFAAVLAYHISLAAPDHQIEYPIQENNPEIAKRKVIDFLLEADDKLVVDKGKNDAKVIDEVGGPHPFRLERSTADEIDDQAERKDEDNKVNFRSSSQGDCKTCVHQDKNEKSENRLLMASVWRVKHLSVRFD